MMSAFCEAKSRAFRALALAGAFLAGMGAALAQNVGPNNIGAGVYGPPFTTLGGHLILGGGPPPTLNAACGTAPSVVGGTDSAFSFTSGTSTSAACAITFALPWKTAPTCSLDLPGASSSSYVITPTGILLTGVADSINYQFICIGKPGG